LTIANPACPQSGDAAGRCAGGRAVGQWNSRSTLIAPVGDGVGQAYRWTGQIQKDAVVLHWVSSYRNVRLVVSELGQLSPTDRWPKLVGPLSEKLESSGLGRVLDVDSLRSAAERRGYIDADEVTVELRHAGYGRELVERLVRAAGLERGKPRTPRRWVPYQCDDYFASPLAERGYYDEPSQFLYILPAELVYEDAEKPFLVIGSAGVDGITWGYRLGMAGVWAWYPIGGEFRYMAPTVNTLLDGWLSGRITV